jgi:segregation and condensation protein A
MHDLDLDVATEFLLIAAILIKLKSDGLLPAAEPEPERLTPFEAREEQIWRLIEYRKFKNAAEELLRRVDGEEAFFYREVEFEDSFTYLMPHLLAGLGIEDLAAALLALRQEEGEVDISFIAPIKINIQDYMERIRETLLSRPRVTFRELTEGMRDRIELIVTFMAMLEMYKRDEVDIEQSERFGDIEIVRTDTAAAG